ncbi:heat-inducible transcriptional repressor HrcA [Alphaproteobacteria bacterium]|jgi:heat-inducible transcriptional repressor|nr:heat-inducible transcriptional repressor HrcA [SAR116 cluster bacterium]MDA9929923.1 heat-inducible transcriptional repressor HrcA [Alphaproteobacteria bacterium]
MNDATLLGLKPRALEIFNALVGAYLETGQPIGSKTLARHLKHDLSPASVRSNMSDLEQAGLLFSPHISAGRVPTETGLRMFVDGLMEFTNDLTKEDRMSIDGECATRGISVDELLEKTSRTLSGLSQCASLVLSPASNAELQHFEFVPLGEKRALAVLVRMDGKVENRLIDLPAGVPQSALIRASNYMNARLSGRDLTAATGLIRSEIAAQRAELDEMSRRLVEQGVGLWSEGNASEETVLVMRGQSNLLDATMFDSLDTGEDLSTIRQLFDELEARENALRLLSATGNGDGVKIFIGAENNLFVNTGCSLVIAPYHNANQTVIGAIGVLGPRHMNYARIIPMVDYTSKAIAAVLS